MTKDTLSLLGFYKMSSPQLPQSSQLCVLAQQCPANEEQDEDKMLKRGEPAAWLLSSLTPHVCSCSRGCNVEPSLCTLRTHPAIKAQSRVHHRSCVQAALPTPAPFFSFSKICNTEDLLPTFFAICSPKREPKTLVFCIPQRSLGQFYKPTHVRSLEDEV